jgi:hypothetical protein
MRCPAPDASKKGDEIAQQKVIAYIAMEASSYAIQRQERATEKTSRIVYSYKKVHTVSVK